MSIDSSAINQWKSKGRLVAESVARSLIWTGATPNVITVVGLLLNVVVALVIAGGYFTVGGILLVLVGLFDALDGAMARVTNQKTQFGAFLDSTIDRYAEAVVLLGLTVSRIDDLPTVVLAYVAIVGSIMVSYTRARAEGLGLRNEVGILARPERVALLAIGLITGWVTPVLIVLAVFTNLTALQRIIHVYRLTGGR